MSKSTKRRDCPALEKQISAAECGENRNSRYSCPAECEFNPLSPAHYSQLLEIEEQFDRRLLDWARKEVTDPNAFDKGFRKAANASSGHALHAFCVWELIFKRDPGGLTCLQRFERAGFPGLKNDARVVGRAKMEMRVTVLEIRRVLDAERTEAVDLLEPEGAPFIIQDRGLAAVAVRFATALTWCFPLPHFTRLFGTAIVLPEMGEVEPVQVVKEIASHLGGPVDGEPLRLWLAENFLRVDEAVTATANARRVQMFASMDAQFGRAVYELRTPFAALREKLDALDEVHADQLSTPERDEGFAEARVWFAPDDEGLPSAPERGQPVLGRVLLGQSHWRLEAIGEKRLATFRERFESFAGREVKFAGERRDNLVSDLLARQPKAEASLVPPRLLENPQRIMLGSSRLPDVLPGGEMPSQAELRASMDRAFLDDFIPGLDNRTPREAAADPVLRPKLIRILKHRVRLHDEENLRTGGTADINWLLRELDATEILFDPPPPRPPTELDQADEPNDDLMPALELPDPPPLPAGHFGMEEAAVRLEKVFITYGTAEKAMAAVAATGSTLLTDAGELAGDRFSDDELGLLGAHVALACLALATPGARIPDIPFLELVETHNAELVRMLQCLETKAPDAPLRYLNGSVQPALAKILARELIVAASEAPSHVQVRREQVPLMFPVIVAVIELLDCALRE